MPRPLRQCADILGRIMETIKTYHELILLDSFEERFEFLKRSGKVGMDTFGFDRYLNQDFYHSKEWRDIRNLVIVRDNGCDLAHPDHPIFGRIIIHHITPLTVDDFVQSTDFLLDPNNLICVSELTHKALHYGSFDLIPKDYVERRPNDTCPWKL